MPLFGPPNVDKLKAKGKSKELVKLLTKDEEKHKKLRIAAAKALGELADPDSIEPLTSYYNRKKIKFSERREAAQALVNTAVVLSKKGDLQALKALSLVLKGKDTDLFEQAGEAYLNLGASAVPELLTFFNNRDWKVQKMAVQTVLKIGKPAIPALVDALRSPDRLTSLTTAQVLTDLNWEPPQDADGAWFWIVKQNWDSVAKIGKSAIEPLVISLENGEKGAAKALGEIGDSSALPALKNILNSGNDPYLQEAAVAAIGKIGNPAAIDSLIEALKFQNSTVSETAATALCQINNQQGITALIAQLGDLVLKQPKKFEITRKVLAAQGEPVLTLLMDSMSNASSLHIEAVLMVLEKMGNPRAVPVLLHFLKSDNSDIAALSARALGEIGDPNTQKELVLSLHHKKRAVRSAAAQALRKTKWTPTVDENGARYWTARRGWEKCVALGKIAVEPLLTELEDPKNKDERIQIIEALGKIGDSLAVEPITAFLKGSSLSIRKQAVIALGDINDPAAIEPLKMALQDKSGDVRTAAIDALGQIGTAECIPILIQQLPDPAAGMALQQIGSPAVEALIRALQSSKEDTRSLAAESLGKIEDKRVIDPLITLLKDNSPKVRKSAVRVLGEIKDQKVVAPLIEILNSDDQKEIRESAADALGQIGGSQAVQGLIEILEDAQQPESLRCKVIEGLSNFRDPKATSAIKTHLQDESQAVRKKIIRTLGQTGHAEAVELLITALPAEEAIQALGKLGDSRAVDPLVKLLPEKDFYKFTAIINALAALYRSGNLSETQKQQLLQQGDTLKKSDSHKSHTDFENEKGCFHYDEGSHSDKHADFQSLIQ